MWRMAAAFGSPYLPRNADDCTPAFQGFRRYVSGVIETSCHCGAVTVAVPRLPDVLTDCNCTICRRYHGLWGYYAPKEVELRGGPTEIYMCNDRVLEMHRCKHCGCVMCWLPVARSGSAGPRSTAEGRTGESTDKGKDRMGVNFRMAEPQAIAGIRVRKLDGFDTWKFLDEPDA
jgi:hypothetical protein